MSGRPTTEGVANMGKPRLAGLFGRREQDFDERAFRNHQASFSIGNGEQLVHQR